MYIFGTLIVGFGQSLCCTSRSEALTMLISEIGLHIISTPTLLFLSYKYRQRNHGPKHESSWDQIFQMKVSMNRMLGRGSYHRIRRKRARQRHIRERLRMCACTSYTSIPTTRDFNLPLRSVETSSEIKGAHIYLYRTTGSLPVLPLLSRKKCGSERVRDLHSRHHVRARTFTNNDQIKYKRYDLSLFFFYSI